MKGWFEVRVDGPQRRHYRLFCRLDYDAKDQSKQLRPAEWCMGPGERVALSVGAPSLTGRDSGRSADGCAPGSNAPAVT